MALKLNLPGKKQVLGPARTWKRVAAFLVDMIIIDFVLFFPFKNLMENILPVTDFRSLTALLETSAPTGLLIAASLSMALVSILYFALLEFKINQTLGKMLLRITVIPVDPKNSLKLWQCLLRPLFLIPIFPFALLWIFDPAYIFFNRGRQRLLELLSKTRTVELYVV